MTTKSRFPLPQLPPEGEILTVDEAIERYKDLWLLMRVTEVDDRQNAVAGQILHVSKTDRGVWNEVTRLHFSPDEPRPVSYYVFCALRRLRGPGALQKALENAKNERLPRGWWS